MSGERAEQVLPAEQRHPHRSQRYVRRALFKHMQDSDGATLPERTVLLSLLGR